MTQSHWLLRVARRHELGGADDLDLSPTVPIRDAWRIVTRQLKLGDEELAAMVADYFRLKRADLELVESHAVALLPEAIIRQYAVMPISETDRYLYVATSDPTDVDAERVLGFRSGRTPVFQVAPPSEITDAIDDRYSPNQAVEGILGGREGADEDALQVVTALGPEVISEEDATATPVVKLTNLILRDGITIGASDIHVEPGRRMGVVRYRVDGVLRKHMDLPMAALNRVISRVKILSKLDIADRLRPQDGRTRVQIGDNVYDLRVSTLPAGRAEKLVIRILDSNSLFTLEDLTMTDHELGRLRQLMSLRDGIIVVTGPTGSGKTTTLYGAMRELATGRVNIMTVEDPIEYELESITQTQVEVKQGVTFASALRAILRQDPDIILVGEIRDRETAEVAAQAALTGHLVLATVHANDAVGAVARLADLGLEYSIIASAVRGVVAQRLIRRVCVECKEPIKGDMTEEEKEMADRFRTEPMVRAKGCSDCGYSGYRGRLPVLEVMSVGLRMQEAIELRKGATTLTHLAEQGGMRSMHEVGFEWVREGLTTLDEVQRVLGQVVTEIELDSGPARVLVVDDDEDDRLMMGTALTNAGYLVETVADGNAALDILAKDKNFSLVVLDLGMPNLTGRDVLERMRASSDLIAVPVLVRTATQEAQSEVDLLNAGADDYISKQAGVDRFLARVAAVLRRSAL